jgi:predicted transcriptional regulator
MQSLLTIPLDDELDTQLEKACSRSGRTPVDFVRDALRRQLAIETFDQLRQQALPYAQKRGVLTDEDIFNSVS